MENSEQNIQRVNEDEIDLADLLRQIWAGRWIIVITTIVFIAMAVLYLLYNNYSGVKEYESQATLFVESPSPDSMITVTKSPLFISEVLKIKLTGLKPGSAVIVAEVLDQQTNPPQGNLTGLTGRINATKGNTGIVVIAVKMQDKAIATQLADSVVQKLTQFLKATQIKRAEKNQLILAEDSTKNFKLISDSFSRNIQFLSKNAAKNLQFLTESYQSAESKYLRAQQSLSDYYQQNSKNQGTIDSLEVKRLNADIKMKFNLYSTLYQQLEQAKIEAKKQFEQGKIEGEKRLEQTKADLTNQLDQVTLDAVKKVPVINVLEPATAATELNVPKTKKVLLLMGFFGIIVGVGIVFGKKFWEKNFGGKS